MADGDQHVLEPMAGRLGVVDLVGDDRRQARFVGQTPARRRASRRRGAGGGTAPRRSPRREVAAHRSAAERAAARSPASRRRGSPVPAAAQPDEMALRLVQRRLQRRRLEHGECLLAGQVAGGHDPRQGGVPGRVAGQQDEVVAGGRTGVVLSPASRGWPSSAEWSAMRRPRRARRSSRSSRGMASSTPRIGCTGSPRRGRHRSGSPPRPSTAGPRHTGPRGR